MVNPKNFIGELGACFGSSRIEIDEGKKRMTDSGKLNHNSTPLARQVASDFARLAEASEEAGEWGDRVADKVLDAFRDETLIEEYIRLDPAILRSRCCASSYAPPGGETKESEDEDSEAEEGAGAAT